jgi:hypothetical protein
MACHHLEHQTEQFSPVLVSERALCRKEYDLHRRRTVNRDWYHHFACYSSTFHANMLLFNRMIIQMVCESSQPSVCSIVYQSLCGMKTKGGDTRQMATFPEASRHDLPVLLHQLRKHKHTAVDGCNVPFHTCNMLEWNSLLYNSYGILLSDLAIVFFHMGVGHVKNTMNRVVNIAALKCRFSVCN